MSETFEQWCKSKNESADNLSAWEAWQARDQEVADLKAKLGRMPCGHLRAELVPSEICGCAEGFEPNDRFSDGSRGHADYESGNAMDPGFTSHCYSYCLACQREDVLKQQLEQSQAACAEGQLSLEKYGQHEAGCRWATELPTGNGQFWGCDCGLESAKDAINPCSALLSRIAALEEKVRAGDELARTLEKSDWCGVMSCALAAYQSAASPKSVESPRKP